MKLINKDKHLKKQTNRKNQRNKTNNSPNHLELLCMPPNQLFHPIFLH